MIKVLTAFSLALFTVVAGAQSYPTRPVTLISPFAPGGLATREQQSPEGLAAFHKAEIDKWWPVIKAANIKVE